MNFNSKDYGGEVAAILALDGDGLRLMPLALGTCSSPAARERLHDVSAADLFAGARVPEAALSGLWLYFSCLDESHRLSQNIAGAEGSFWHGIMHRQEPDASNSGYWFRKVGTHPVFLPLHVEAVRLCEKHPGGGFKAGRHWDPFAFIDFCDAAGERPGSDAEKLALEIQRAEWQLLFDWCARPAR